MIDLASIFSDKQRQGLNSESPVPLYYQLYRILKTCVLEGKLTHGMQMPTELQLSSEFGVSRITSKRALDELAMEGLVERQRGKGTHVIHRLEQSPLHAPMIGLLQEIESIGQESTALVVDSGVMQPPKEVREILGFEPGGTALYLARVRQKNNLRFGYYRSWTVGMKLPRNLNVFVKTPRMTYFRSKGLEVSYMKQIISAQGAPPDAAEALGIHIGTPLLSLTRLSYVAKEALAHPVDYLRVLYHPGRFEYHIDLELEKQT